LYSESVFIVFSLIAPRGFSHPLSSFLFVVPLTSTALLCVSLGLGESTRVRGMRVYYEKERTELAMQFAERMNHISDRIVQESLDIADPVRPDMMDRFKDHNVRRGLYKKKGGTSSHNASAQQISPVGKGGSKKEKTRLRDAMNMVNSDNQSINSAKSSLSGNDFAAVVTKASSLAPPKKQKPVFVNKFLDSSQTRRASKLDTANFKYPANVNFKPMDWLFSDDD
jgi:hypothetical protein